jgi:CheY-like chemotaxis protein
MPDMSGVDVLRAAKRIDQDILGIMITAFASTDTAVEAMRLGACDYLSKPFDIDLLKMKVREKIENRQLRQENLLLKRTLGLSHEFSNIIGRSEAMVAVFKMIETVARTNSTILLTGESGTGKGLVAQAIHFHSLRREKPMVSLNCGALPEALLESELFGHMRGSFTGADSNRSAGSAASAASKSCRPTSASSPRPIRISRRRSAMDGSAKISTTASTSSRSPCRRSGSGARTSRSSPSISSRSTTSRWRSSSPGSRTRRWIF